ncbi:hypothetical protein U3516DRAFT_665160 [Neocallimastix sp. 'constans']
MDIDNNESHSINYVSNVRNYDKQTKFCIICGNQGHFAKDCYFNSCGTNKNNSKVKIINNKNNNYNKGSRYNNNKRRNKNNNHLNENTVSLTQNTKVSSENYIFNSRDNIGHDTTRTILWTYDTGSSEHITNDISILENFTKTNITMKCANKSTCTFEGFGRFNRIINGHKIILEKVFYSKDIKINKPPSYNKDDEYSNCNIDKNKVIYDSIINSQCKILKNYVCYE